MTNDPESPEGRELTPAQIVERLDRYIVGQSDAKRAVAIAMRNRWRRQQVSGELREEITPKNIIMIGPTGVGKTEIARRLARLARAPFFKVEASKFTEVGYVGRDVESMVRDLVEISLNLVREEHEERVEAKARAAVAERIFSVFKPWGDDEREPLDGSGPKGAFIAGMDGTVEAVDSAPKDLRRQRLEDGDFDDEVIEIEVMDSPAPQLDSLADGMGLQGVDFGIFQNIFSGRKHKKRLSVGDARRVLFKEEAWRLIDEEAVKTEALRRAEQSGIIFIDEIDKVAGTDKRVSADVSREGVQRDLLPIVEGSSVTTKHGVVKTDHVLFIAAGAFHVAKPSDLIPELQGRFPIRVELHSLTRDDFSRILTEPRNSLTRQYVELLRTEKVEVEITASAVETIADMAQRVNESLEDIGARRLHTIMEKVFEALAFDAPDRSGEHVVIDDVYVRERLEGILKDQDLSRYIL